MKTHSNVPFLPLGSSVIPPKNSSVFANKVAKVCVCCFVVVCFIVYIIGTTTTVGSDYAPIPVEQPNTNDSITVCKEYYNDTRRYIQDRPSSDYADIPTIYFVTPTYPRREQMPEIIRLGHTLMHVPKIHWIVADDVDQCNVHLDSLLMEFGIPFTHISSPMNNIYRHLKNVPRGVANRRAALNWIKTNNKSEGVLYFGDDDNTFHLKLFSEIRHTKVVSMFPVGLIGNYAVSSPVVRDGKVIGFFDSWIAGRKWAVDMAGFAVNLEYLFRFKNQVTMPYKAGYEEDKFLKSLNLELEEIEPKANNCTEILVYHTQTKKTKSPDIMLPHSITLSSSSTSNIAHLFRFMENSGVSHFTSSKGVKPEVSYRGKKLPMESVY